MSYIGKEPTVGNFQVCDAISTVNNQAAYTMQVAGVNVVPETVNHMLVSLNGILQAPTSSFTVSGSTITFAANLVTGDVINFIQILGSVLDLGVPSDSTVSIAKLTATGTKDATTFLRGDNTFAAAGGGKILQLVHTEIETYPSRSAGSTYADIAGLNLSITPSSTSSKILIVFNAGVVANSSVSASFVLKRAISGGSTTTLGGHTDSSRQAAWLRHTSISDGNHDNGANAQYYDTSHNTTSAITYTVQWMTQGTGYLNRNTSFENNNTSYSTVTNSRIYAMEVGA